jgi:hypothetical protein
LQIWRIAFYIDVERAMDVGTQKQAIREVTEDSCGEWMRLQIALVQFDEDEVARLEEELKKDLLSSGLLILVHGRWPISCAFEAYRLSLMWMAYPRASVLSH